MAIAGSWIRWAESKDAQKCDDGLVSQSMRARTCRLGPLPLVCKRFQRLLSDPNDRRMWSALDIRASFEDGSEHSHQRFLAFLGLHLHQVEVADLEQVGGLASFFRQGGPNSIFCFL